MAVESLVNSLTGFARSSCSRCAPTSLIGAAERVLAQWPRLLALLITGLHRNASIRSSRVLAINDGLDRLAAEAPDVAELVKLRVFAGLSVTDAAQASGVCEVRCPKCNGTAVDILQMPKRVGWWGEGRASCPFCHIEFQITLEGGDDLPAPTWENGW